MSNQINRILFGIAGGTFLFTAIVTFQNNKGATLFAFIVAIVNIIRAIKKKENW